MNETPKPPPALPAGGGSFYPRPVIASLPKEGAAINTDTSACFATQAITEY